MIQKHNTSASDIGHNTSKVTADFGIENEYAISFFTSLGIASSAATVEGIIDDQFDQETKIGFGIDDQYFVCGLREAESDVQMHETKGYQKYTPRFGMIIHAGALAVIMAENGIDDASFGFGMTVQANSTRIDSDIAKKIKSDMSEFWGKKKVVEVYLGEGEWKRVTIRADKEAPAQWALLPESIGAIVCHAHEQGHTERDGTIAVIDVGGGTTEIIVIEYNDGKPDVTHYLSMEEFGINYWEREKLPIILRRIFGGVYNPALFSGNEGLRTIRNAKNKTNVYAEIDGERVTLPDVIQDFYQEKSREIFSIASRENIPVEFAKTFMFTGGGGDKVHNGAVKGYMDVFGGKDLQPSKFVSASRREPWLANVRGLLYLMMAKNNPSS